MEKQEIKITDNFWPVFVKESDKGIVKAVCPFFPDCNAEGENEGDALQKIESQITKKIEETRSTN